MRPFAIVWAAALLALSLRGSAADAGPGPAVEQGGKEGAGGEMQRTAPAPDPEAAKRAKIDALLREADQLYDKRYEKGNAEKVIAKAREVLKLEPDNYEALWRIARAAYWIADGTSNKKLKEKWGKIGWDAGAKGAKLAPDRIEAQFWGAAALGHYAKGVGVLKAVWDGLGKRYEKWVRKAYEIDKTYANGGPPRALGRYYYTLPGIAGGDNDKAIQYLEESKKIAPHALRTRAWLAEVYIDEGEKEKARAELEYCVKADPHQGDYADNLRMQPRCKELLGKLD